MTNKWEKIPLSADHWYCGPGGNEIDEAFKVHPTELRDVVDRNDYIRKCLKIIREFGDFTLPHSLRVARYCWELGRDLKLNPMQMEKFVSAGLVHDLGKIFVSPEILQKNSSMTKGEIEIMHEHVRNSFKFIQETDPYVAEIIVRHHENRADNRYPRSNDRRKNSDEHQNGEERRQGERRRDNQEVDLLARYLAIIDEFESLTSLQRPYRQPLNMESLKDQKEIREIFQKDYPHPEDGEVVDKLILISQYLEKTFQHAA